MRSTAKTGGGPDDDVVDQGIAFDPATLLSRQGVVRLMGPGAGGSMAGGSGGAPGGGPGGDAPRP